MKKSKKLSISNRLTGREKKTIKSAFQVENDWIVVCHGLTARSLKSKGIAMTHRGRLFLTQYGCAIRETLLKNA